MEKQVIEDWVEDWVAWSEEPRELEAEKWVGEKLKSVIKPMFGVECIVVKEETEINRALVSEVIPVPRFAKLFKEPILSSKPCTLDTLAQYSQQKGYNLEETINILNERIRERENTRL